MTAVAVQSDPGEAPVPRPARLKLYEAGAELEAAFELLAEAEGEMTPEIEELLNEAVGNFDEKAERVALAVREYQTTAAAEKAQADAIAQLAVAPHIARAKSAERSADSLKAYLLRELTKAGGEQGPRKIEGKRVKIRVQKNSQPSVRVVGVELANVGDFFRRLFESAGEGIRGLVTQRVEYLLDSKRAVELHKAGIDLPTEIVIETGSHVRIS